MGLSREAPKDERRHESTGSSSWLCRVEEFQKFLPEPKAWSFSSLALWPRAATDPPSPASVAVRDVDIQPTWFPPVLGQAAGAAGMRWTIAECDHSQSTGFKLFHLILPTGLGGWTELLLTLCFTDKETDSWRSRDLPNVTLLVRAAGLSTGLPLASMQHSGVPYWQAVSRLTRRPKVSEDLPWTAHASCQYGDGLLELHAAQPVPWDTSVPFCEAFEQVPGF